MRILITICQKYSRSLRLHPLSPASFPLSWTTFNGTSTPAAEPIISEAMSHARRVSFRQNPEYISKGAPAAKVQPQREVHAARSRKPLQPANDLPTRFKGCAIKGESGAGAWIVYIFTVYSEYGRYEITSTASRNVQSRQDEHRKSGISTTIIQTLASPVTSGDRSGGRN